MQHSFLSPVDNSLYFILCISVLHVVCYSGSPDVVELFPFSFIYFFDEGSLSFFGFEPRFVYFLLPTGQCLSRH